MMTFFPKTEEISEESDKAWGAVHNCVAGRVKFAVNIRNLTDKKMCEVARGDRFIDDPMLFNIWL
jgi:hypothetical protein